MSKHTPGPWSIFKSAIEGTWIDPIGIRTDEGGLPENREANARLIAAAPDGYELLASMREWAEEEEQDLNSEDRPFAVKILAYLSKAEGTKKE